MKLAEHKSVYERAAPASFMLEHEQEGFSEEQEGVCK